MTLPIDHDYPPMEAELEETLPVGDDWVYEPKWDGFRCVAFRDGDDVDLRSKAGKPLARYFPDVAEAVGDVGARRFVLDGEIVIPVGDSLSFDELLLRVHPAASRVKKLVEEHPALYVVFDLLVDAKGRDLTKKPLGERRAALEDFAERFLEDGGPIRISPETDDIEVARGWLKGGRGGLDGVVAKRRDVSYRSGDRTGMVKVKRLRTADCVVGGFRWAKHGRAVGSLLLGLYGDDGLLHHVGFCGSMTAAVRRQAGERLLPLRGGAGFTGKSPGGPSRWRKEGTEEFESVEPVVVVEVQYDHFTAGRFRHGTRFLRWRPDKKPRSCRMEQVEKEARSAVGMI